MVNENKRGVWQLVDNSTPPLFTALTPEEVETARQVFGDERADEMNRLWGLADG